MNKVIEEKKRFYDRGSNNDYPHTNPSTSASNASKIETIPRRTSFMKNAGSNIVTEGNYSRPSQKQEEPSYNAYNDRKYSVSKPPTGYTSSTSNGTNGYSHTMGPRRAERSEPLTMLKYGSNMLANEKYYDSSAPIPKVNSPASAGVNYNPNNYTEPTNRIDYERMKSSHSTYSKNTSIDNKNYGLNETFTSQKAKRDVSDYTPTKIARPNMSRKESRQDSNPLSKTDF